MSLLMEERHVWTDVMASGECQLAADIVKIYTSSTAQTSKLTISPCSDNLNICTHCWQFNVRIVLYESFIASGRLSLCNNILQPIPGKGNFAASSSTMTLKINILPD
ncbi:hypothetical protein TNCT_346771 [Trichonephila clavata]|uniref:Uncharacterized protein n=1 Tax=Trichonephila clavata TaxID=2740835 RepID=A0A8X6GVR8_TRICU|nr:hypothetical protein TNCT_346771 [Trichonephila clavata]